MLIGCNTETQQDGIDLELFNRIKTGFLMFIIGWQDGVTLEQFNRVQTGMTLIEVISIMGHGTLDSEVDLGIGAAFVTRMYSWNGRGSIGANASIMFQGGRVVSKAQAGLR